MSIMTLFCTIGSERDKQSSNVSKYSFDIYKKLVLMEARSLKEMGNL